MYIVWEKRVFNDERLKKEDLCGNDQYPDANMNIKIDKLFSHNSKELKISFGSTLDKNPCDASFGIDDLIVYIK